MSTQAYPLHWPAGWPRTATKEAGNQFRTTLSAALNQLRDEVKRLGGTDLILSSNCTLGNEKPSEPGVVAYFKLKGQNMAIPCDRWAKVEHNVRAIALTIEAMRGMDRWGAKHMISAMFQGFKALPGAAASRPWWEVLGMKAGACVTAADVNEAFRRLSKTCHPDSGGSHDAMAELNSAREEALASLRR